MRHAKRNAKAIARLVSVVLPTIAANLPGQADHKTPDPFPSVAETHLLELVNRFRTRPDRSADWIQQLAPKFADPPVDWKMFADELARLEAVPPLAFAPRLALAARNHSNYTIDNREWGHKERETGRGFTGVNPQARCRHVGYRGTAEECTFGNTTSIAHAFAAFVVDHGPGPGGMQPRRGHRKAMMKRAAREFGAGWVAWKQKGDRRHACTFFVGNGSGRRIVSGVAYADWNGNDMYDPGEGIGGVTIAAAGRTTASTPSGAWWIEIGKKPTKIRTRFFSSGSGRRLPRGDDNIKYDVRLEGSLSVWVDAIEHKLGRLTDPTRKAARRLRCSLLARTYGIALPSRLATRVEALTRDVGEVVERHRKALRDAVRAPKSADLREIDSIAKRYRGTDLAAWFDQGTRLLRALTATSPKKRTAALLAQLSAPEWRRRVLDDRNQW